MSQRSNPVDSDQPDRATRIQHVVDDCLLARAKGQVIIDESLIQAHPDLMPELADELRKLRMIEQAVRKAGQAERHSEHSDSPGLHIRCPHCHNPVELVDDHSLSKVVCPS